MPESLALIDGAPAGSPSTTSHVLWGKPGGFSRQTCLFLPTGGEGRGVLGSHISVVSERM